MFNYEALQIILQEGASDVIQSDMEGHVKHWRGKKKNRLWRKQFALSRNGGV